jgi:hypothetical protein
MSKTIRPVRRFERTHVLDVRITAQLNRQASVGLCGEISGHNGHCAPKERKRRRGHALILNRKKPRDTTRLSRRENLQRIKAFLPGRFSNGCTGNPGAGLLTELDALLRRCGHVV